MVRMFTIAVALVALGGLAAGCGDEKSSSAKESKATSSMTDSKQESSTPAADAAEDIVDTAVAAGDFGTLVAAVQAAGLEETLRGEGPFTVFAPTDAAFDKLGQSTLDSLLKPENKQQLADILTYHVVPSKAMAGDLMDGQQLTTVNGQKLAVAIKDGVVTIGGAKVTSADVAASNGVIHVIDTVLQPS
jgi:uncharacterized surface protein with fasciclin (FAS1) repeats